MKLQVELTNDQARLLAAFLDDVPMSAIQEVVGVRGLDECLSAMLRLRDAILEVTENAK